MFEKFFNRNKNNDIEYVSCPYIQAGVTFMDDSVRLCCSNKRGVYLVNKPDGKKIDWKKIKKIRKQVIENCKKGILPANCVGCISLEKKAWDNSDDKIKELFFNHWNHCNCGCVYCIQLGNGTYLEKEPRESDFYNAYGYLVDMYKHNMISKNVKVELVGGEIAILKEANDIINLCLEHGVGSMSFHSSCIGYSEGIARSLREVKDTCFDFSVDCASRELYKKIKRIDAFDTVIANVKKYLSESEDAKDKIIAKYIIVDGLNDNVEEVDKWLKLMHDIGIKRAKIDVNFLKYFSEVNPNNPTVPKVYYEIFDLFYKRIEEYGMQDCCWEFSKRVMKESGIPEGYRKVK